MKNEESFWHFPGWLRRVWCSSRSFWPQVSSLNMTTGFCLWWIFTVTVVTVNLQGYNGQWHHRVPKTCWAWTPENWPFHAVRGGYLFFLSFFQLTFSDFMIFTFQKYLSLLSTLCQDHFLHNGSRKPLHAKSGASVQKFPFVAAQATAVAPLVSRHVQLILDEFVASYKSRHPKPVIDTEVPQEGRREMLIANDYGWSTPCNSMFCMRWPV